MRRALLVVLILALGVAEADARRRGHRYYQATRFERYVVPVVPGARDRPRPMPYGVAPPSWRQAPSHTQDDASRLIPPGWQLQPPDANWNGRRYLSPDGAAWVAFYSAPADQEPIAAYMKAIAFIDGEEITYLRGERDWLVASGLKGDRIFYRKAALACGGKSWHNVAFEYPADVKPSMDRLVTYISRALDDYENSGCDAAVSSR